MCGRYALIAVPSALLEELELELPREVEPRYNIAPTQPVAIVRAALSQPKTGPLQPELTHVSWGLIPPWAKDISIAHKLINARAETVAEKPSFRHAYKRRRCLVPASGFYEWRRRPANAEPGPAAGTAKKTASSQPYFIHMRDEDEPLAFGGLWEAWHGPNGELLETCCIITTHPNELMRPLHDRQPVIIPQREYRRWLDCRSERPGEVADLLEPIEAEYMAAQPVSTAVNSPRNQGAELIEPVSAARPLAP